MLLAVFAGITMFGFLGIVIGPVLMIVIVTTISVYLAVYKGVPLDDPETTTSAEEPGPRLIAVARTACGPPRSEAAEAKPRLRREQPLREERDDPLARLVGRVAVDLADLDRSAPSGPSCRIRRDCPSPSRSR